MALDQSLSNDVVVELLRAGEVEMDAVFWDHHGLLDSTVSRLLEVCGGNLTVRQYRDSHFGWGAIGGIGFNGVPLKVVD